MVELRQYLVEPKKQTKIQNKEIEAFRKLTEH